MYHKIKKILSWASEFYRPDSRALSLMRIGIALVVIADLWIRSSDLAAHYTDEGIWPTRLLYNFAWQPGFWSLHALSGSYAWLLFLFALHFLMAVCLLLGYRTRPVTFLLWLFTISLHNRNVFILQSGDDLLRMVLLWACFLPWGNHYSIDARAGRRKEVNSFANLAYLLLLASVYFFSASLKSGAEWHREGSAIYYALSLEQMRLPWLGDWLYQYPALMKALTAFVFYAELLIPILVLWPSRRGYLRCAAFALILILHTGIGLTLYVGLFFIISMVSALGLLPAFVMDQLEKKMRIKGLPETDKIPRPSFFRAPVNGFITVATVFCLILNFSGLSWFNYTLHSSLNYPVNLLRLNQYWGMFSPVILKSDGWFVYHGIDSAGRQWNLRNNSDYVDYAKPRHIIDTYRNDRWRKLAENMQDDHFTFLRPLYCSYVLAQWNKNHREKKITTLNLYFMEKKSLPDYKTTAIQKKLFCVCVDD